MSFLTHVMQVYFGSDGEATKRLYAKLEGQCGINGIIAVNLFRAQKCSHRAKVYRGGGYKGMAYDRKQWSMTNLAKILSEHGEACGITWGWQIDRDQSYHPWVLYLDLPDVGQVSFHTAERGVGPDYTDKWDGVRGVSPQRVCTWVAKVLDSHLAEKTA